MTDPVRIPADIERDDRILGPLTARQVALLAAGGILLYGGYRAASLWLSPLAYLALTCPVAGVVVGVALGRREGIGMDRFFLAALKHAHAPKRMVHAPEGVPDLPGFLDRALVHRAGPRPVPAQVPCRSVDGAGVLDLGREGSAAVGSCSTVNFQLCTGAERHSIVGGFARWLNSLTGPAQVLLRSHPVSLTPTARHLRRHAPTLPHPALSAAALAHADFLDELGHHRELLARQVLVTVREPAPGPAGKERAAQRLAETAAALATADLDVRPLDGAQATDVINAAYNPPAPHAGGGENL